MQYLFAMMIAISNVQSDANVPPDPDIWDGLRLRAIQVPEHLEDDEDTQLLAEYRRSLVLKRYETYGDLEQQGNLLPRGAQGIPISCKELQHILSIGRKELAKDEIDFEKLSLVLNCLNSRPRNRKIVSFLKEVMQAPFSIVEMQLGSGTPLYQSTTINRVLWILAQQNTREARAILYECATILIDPEGCKYFRTKEGELMPPHRLELIARVAISYYIYFSPEGRVLPFVRRVKAAYEQAGVGFWKLDIAMYRAVELSKGNDLRRQPRPVP